jgi:hypothetical protein
MKPWPTGNLPVKVRSCESQNRIALLPAVLHSPEIVRLLFEILVVGALIYLGWEQPFKERVDQARVKVTGKQAPVAPKEITPTRTPAPRIVPGIIREPTPPRSPWRLDPTHRSPLGPPLSQSPSPH